MDKWVYCFVSALKGVSNVNGDDDIAMRQPLSASFHANEQTLWFGSSFSI